MKKKQQYKDLLLFASHKKTVCIIHKRTKQQGSTYGLKM